MSNSLPFALLLLVLALLSGPPHLGFASAGWFQPVLSYSEEIQESQKTQTSQEIQETQEPQERGNHRERSRYGQNCSDTLKCESASWLSCQNNTCQCFKPNEMKYDDTTQKCVSQIGERCRFGINQDSGSGSGNRIIYEVTGCGPNADCNREGICICHGKFFENTNGDCTPKLGHLESCNSESDIECLDNQGLSCHGNQCRCEDLKSVYSDSENQCVGLGRQPCINSKCSQYAYCSIENICECQNNFYPNSEDGICLPKIAPLQNCTEDAQCLQINSQPLVCLDGVCSCNPANSILATARASYHQEYLHDEYHDFEGPELTQCVGLVDSDCVDRLCVPNAFCSYSAPLVGRPRATTRRTTTRRPARRRNYYGSDSEEVEINVDDHTPVSVESYAPTTTPSWNMETLNDRFNRSGTCKCLPSYVKTKYQTCAAPLNFTCASTGDCTDGLVCRDVKCVCPYNIQSYDAPKKTCISSIGGPCDPSPSSVLSCGKNADCEPVAAGAYGERQGEDQDEGEKGAGHCVCHKDYVEGPNGKCIMGYGGPCRKTADCDSVPQLACIDKKCGCPAFQDYNASVRKCVGLVGAKCEGFSRECTQNAHCHIFNTHVQGSCVCNKGFQENRNYTCDSAPALSTPAPTLKTKILRNLYTLTVANYSHQSSPLPIYG